MHLYRNGRQCVAEARQGAQLCADHTPLPEPEHESNGRPLVYRLAALALLLIFLYSYYQSVLGWLVG
jgi:hypothetical protein